MIRMPRRSVTRFFIPLIDVLLLLFCIFLLMPVFSDEDEGNGSKARPSAEDLADELQSLRREYDRLQEDLHKYEQWRDPARDLELLRAELQRLRKEKEQAYNRPILVKVIDIDGKTGGLSFYDPARLEGPTVPIPDRKSAQALIAQHKKESGGKVLYYQFLFPRRETGRPTIAQTREYRQWFAGVANSLEEKLP
jgi:hypothetical protein